MMMPRHRRGVGGHWSHKSALAAKEVRGDKAMLRARIALCKVPRMLADAIIILIALIVAQALRHGYHQALEAESGSKEGIAQVIGAINDRRIIDDRDPAYFNHSFLDDGGMAFFTRTRSQWERQLA